MMFIYGVVNFIDYLELTSTANSSFSYVDAGLDLSSVTSLVIDIEAGRDAWLALTSSGYTTAAGAAYDVQYQSHVICAVGFGGFGNVGTYIVGPRGNLEGQTEDLRLFQKRWTTVWISWDENTVRIPISPLPRRRLWNKLEYE